MNGIKDLITNILILLSMIYMRVLLCFIRAFVWAIPIWLGWNKIIVQLTGFSCMRYSQAYWVCVIFMTTISAIFAININKKNQ